MDYIKQLKEDIPEIFISVVGISGFVNLMMSYIDTGNSVIQTLQIGFILVLYVYHVPFLNMPITIAINLYNRFKGDSK